MGQRYSVCEHVRCNRLPPTLTLPTTPYYSLSSPKEVEGSGESYELRFVNPDTAGAIAAQNHLAPSREMNDAMRMIHDAKTKLYEPASEEMEVSVSPCVRFRGCLAAVVLLLLECVPLVVCRW